MDTISLGIAFLAGILSFLSPCVLPVVPGYITFLSGVSLEELQAGARHKRIFKKAGLLSVFFVIGFSIVFISFGASASFIGKLLANHIVLLTRIAGAVIVVFGLHLLGILKINWLNYGKHMDLGRTSPGFFSALLMGIAFGFGWSPCVGPILAGILALAATQKTLARGIVLLTVYSLGLGIPFIITGFAVGVFMRFFEKYKRFIRWGQIAAGVLLVTVGILIFSDNLGVLLDFVPQVFFKFAK